MHGSRLRPIRIVRCPDLPARELGSPMIRTVRRSPRRNREIVAGLLAALSLMFFWDSSHALPSPSWTVRIGTSVLDGTGRALTGQDLSTSRSVPASVQDIGWVGSDGRPCSATFEVRPAATNAEPPTLRWRARVSRGLTKASTGWVVGASHSEPATLRLRGAAAPRCGTSVEVTIQGGPKLDPQKDESSSVE